MKAVRQVHPELIIQADANGSYSLEADPDDPHAAIRLGELADFDVRCVEQPLPPADLVAHAELRRRIGVPICLDESLSSPRRVLDALRNEACHGLPQAGPPRRRRRHPAGARRLCGRRRLRLRRRLLRSRAGAGRQPGSGRPTGQSAIGLVSDLSDPADYLAVDPCGYPGVRQGRVEVPEQPGVGHPPGQELLDDLGAQRRWFPATYT